VVARRTSMGKREPEELREERGQTYKSEVQSKQLRRSPLSAKNVKNRKVTQNPKWLIVVGEHGGISPKRGKHSPILSYKKK